MNKDTALERTLDGYGVTDPGRRFSELDAIVELAAMVTGSSMAAVNILTRTEQHWVATYGLPSGVIPREDSMCARIIEGPTPVVIPDAAADRRLADSPLVNGEIDSLRHYASHTLQSPDGVVFGTLCVFGTEPRQLTEEQAHGLSLLAGRVVDSLELSVREHQLQETLARNEEILRELATSNARLAEFAAQVSHDLKTPLTSMSLSLELIREQVEAGESADDTMWLVERSIAGTQRMGEFIDQNLARAALLGELPKREVDLAAVLDDVLVDLGKLLGEDVLEESSLPTVSGDPIQLGSVLQNLLHNAVKFRRRGRPLRIAIRARRVEEAWRIEVADNGSGLSEEDRARVFERHERAHDQVAGTGIGLDTCRRIVEAHGGTIGLEDRPEGGTTAWFELPD